MKGLLISVSVAVLLAAAHAGPVGSLSGTERSGKAGSKTPVGTCPEKDGEIPVYLPDAEDCSVFYECSGGEPMPKECMPGLCFNDELDVCDWPESLVLSPFDPVGDCPPRDTNVTVFLPDSANCTVYYQCSNGHPIKKECGGGTEWNTEINVCDDPLNFDCAAEGEANIVTYEVVGQCPPRDGNATTFLADSANCTVYYQCSNGMPIPRACGEGTAWNPAINVCDDPLNFECTLGGQARHRSRRSPVGTCPGTDPANPVFLPDSENCSLYYECSNGVPVMNNCADNLVWNPTLKTCVDPLDYDCENATTNTPETTQEVPTTAAPTTAGQL